MKVSLLDEYICRARTPVRGYYPLLLYFNLFIFLGPRLPCICMVYADMLAYDLSVFITTHTRRQGAEAVSALAVTPLELRWRLAVLPLCYMSGCFAHVSSCDMLSRLMPEPPALKHELKEELYPRLIGGIDVRLERLRQTAHVWRVYWRLCASAYPGLATRL